MAGMRQAGRRRGIAALVALGLVGALTSPGGAAVPPPASVVLGAASVAQGGRVLVTTSLSRCGTSVTRGEFGLAPVIGRLTVTDAQTGRIMVDRFIPKVESLNSAPRTFLRIPSTFAVGAYRVFVACFNSAADESVRFAPAALTVTPAPPSAPLAAPTLTPSAVAFGASTTVQVRLPVLCDLPGRRVNIGISIRPLSADGPVLGFEPSIVVPSSGAASVSILLPESPASRLAVGRYQVEADCSTAGAVRRTVYPPAGLVVGGAPSVTPTRLSVSPTTVVAGRTVVVGSACVLGSGSVRVALQQTGEQLGTVETSSTASSVTLQVPATAAAGRYLVHGACVGRARGPVILTVTAAPALFPARPVTAVTPNVIGAGFPVGISVDRRFCSAAASTMSFPFNAQRAVLVSRASGAKVADRSWNFVDRPFRFDTSGIRAGTYHLFVTCRMPRTQELKFEPLVVTLR